MTEREARLADGTLAGSVLDLITASAQSHRLHRLRPERRPGDSHHHPGQSVGFGGIRPYRPGSRADLVLLNDDLQVDLTLIAGDIVYRKPTEVTTRP